MEITFRDLMTMVHGMAFGGFFLMAVFALVVMLWRSMHEAQAPGLTAQGHRWEYAYLIGTAALGWVAVLTGAYIVYPWYRAVMPAGADITLYPKALLLAKPQTTGWHTLGMEWKEHIAWIAPMAMTTVAYVLMKYSGTLEEHRAMRRRVLMFAVVALVSTGVAGGFGALIDKTAPMDGGTVIQLMRTAR